MTGRLFVLNAIWLIITACASWLAFEAGLHRTQPEIGELKSLPVAATLPGVAEFRRDRQQEMLLISAERDRSAKMLKQSELALVDATSRLSQFELALGDLEAEIETLKAEMEAKAPITEFGQLVFDTQGSNVYQDYHRVNQFFNDRMTSVRMTKLLNDNRFRYLLNASAREAMAQDLIEAIGLDAYEKLEEVFRGAPGAMDWRDLPDDPQVQREHRVYFAIRGLLSVRRLAPAFKNK